MEDFKTQIETEVSAYQQALELRAVELKMQEVNVTENNLIASQASTQQALQEQRQKEVRDEDIAKVKVKVDSLESEYEEFYDEITDVAVDQWENEMDINVSRAMK